MSGLLWNVQLNPLQSPPVFADLPLVLALPCSLSLIEGSYISSSPCCSHISVAYTSSLSNTYTLTYWLKSRSDDLHLSIGIEFPQRPPVHPGKGVLCALESKSLLLWPAEAVSPSCTFHQSLCQRPGCHPRPISSPMSALVQEQTGFRPTPSHPQRRPKWGNSLHPLNPHVFPRNFPETLFCSFYCNLFSGSWVQVVGAGLDHLRIQIRAVLRWNHPHHWVNDLEQSWTLLSLFKMNCHFL